MKFLLKIEGEEFEIKVTSVLKLLLVMVIYYILLVGTISLCSAASNDYDYYDNNKNYVIINKRESTTTVVDLNSIVISDEITKNDHKYYYVNYGLAVIYNNKTEYYQNSILIIEGKEGIDSYYKLSDYWIQTNPNNHLDNITHKTGLILLNEIKAKRISSLPY